MRWSSGLVHSGACLKAEKKTWYSSDFLSNIFKRMCLSDCICRTWAVARVGFTLRLFHQLNKRQRVKQTANAPISCRSNSPRRNSSRKVKEIPATPPKALRRADDETRTNRARKATAIAPQKAASKREPVNGNQSGLQYQHLSRRFD